VAEGPGPLKRLGAGGKKSRAMSGHHRFLLAFFKKVCPHAMHTHSSVFIAIHSHNGRVSINVKICLALKDMRMTWKKGSNKDQKRKPKSGELEGFGRYSDLTLCSGDVLYIPWGAYP